MDEFGLLLLPARLRLTLTLRLQKEKLTKLKIL